MNPGEALDRTLNAFNIKAADIARKVGIGTNELSRYRRGHNDMLSYRAFEIVKALPIHAQMYFFSLCMYGENQEPHCVTPGQV
ncbi:MAG: helix-turn-helix transcriptional regulator [Jaaginema sp. PMC 1079.18]|nr:helix-turn-helix transcriptional regulator [Jaaginema sp. PMC 1080.18]MEC4850101.1 helix-turn-helix transcriptional regulator [Jaaginema sp. PMC 1079.18]MEC4864811.1 helix-turn-helix transcriptional regulator [Jaaginema sp. PMC 1078.18]